MPIPIFKKDQSIPYIGSPGKYEFYKLLMAEVSMFEFGHT